MKDKVVRVGDRIGMKTGVYDGHHKRTGFRMVTGRVVRLIAEGRAIRVCWEQKDAPLPCVPIDQVWKIDEEGLR